MNVTYLLKIEDKDHLTTYYFLISEECFVCLLDNSFKGSNQCFHEHRPELH